MNAYDLLADPVKNWIDTRGWTSFTPIQAAAIPSILSGSGALLVSSTASGKTEAAVLPIVSRIFQKKSQPIALLYVAPLKALINDQARRVERILSETYLRSAWWHGELSPSRREAILKHPPHALLTTPESLEVIMSSEKYGNGALLGNVRFVLIDEIHAFVESDRGSQLMSLLTRLEIANARPLQRIALSATVGNPASLTTWLLTTARDACSIETIAAGPPKPRRIGFGILASTEAEDSGEADHEKRFDARLGRVVAQHVRGTRSLVFTNSRKMAETVTALLAENDIEAFIHHGSVDREVRQRAEDQFRIDGPKTIVATSTLELGIDIGDLDQCVQLGAPASASSFLQRLGRSGRRDGKESVGYIYALSEQEIPPALAVADLAHRGISEELVPDTQALHVLVHQLVQLARQIDGPSQDECFRILTACGAFKDVDRSVFDDVCLDLTESKYIEVERDRLRVGPEAERRFGAMNFRDFYAVFTVDPAWQVKCGNDPIGSLDLSYPVSETRETVFILAGRKWKVEAVDRQRRLLLVVPAPRAKIPTWGGDSVPYSFEVMRRTCELLSGQTSPLESETITKRLKPHREAAASIGLSPRSLIVEAMMKKLYVHLYAGVRANRYLGALLQVAIAARCDAYSSHIEVHLDRGTSFRQFVDELTAIVASVDRRQALSERIVFDPDEGAEGKFGVMLGPRSRVHRQRANLHADMTQFERLHPQSLVVETSKNLQFI